MSIERDDGSLANAHKVLGTIVFALLLLQVRTTWYSSAVNVTLWMVHYNTPHPPDLKTALQNAVRMVM